eukprot:683142-Rhodomonas_salina.18
MLKVSLGRQVWAVPTTRQSVCLALCHALGGGNANVRGKTGDVQPVRTTPAPAPAAPSLPEPAPGRPPASLLACVAYQGGQAHG